MTSGGLAVVYLRCHQNFHGNSLWFFRHPRNARVTPGQGNGPHVYCISIHVSFNKNVTITAKRDWLATFAQLLGSSRHRLLWLTFVRVCWLCPLPA